MNKQTKKFIEQMNRLSYTVRYPTVMHIKDETVADHSFQVAMIVMLLSEEYEFDSSVAIGIALVHDIPEIELTDIPHPVKQKHKKLAKQFVKAEQKVVEMLPDSIQWYFELMDMDIYSLELRIVQLADAISCYQYAQGEVKLGNEYMQRVLDESKNRIKELEKGLTRWKL